MAINTIWMNRNFLDYSLIHLEFDAFEFPDFIPHDCFILENLNNEKYRKSLKIRLQQWLKQCLNNSKVEVLSPSVIDIIKQCRKTVPLLTNDISSVLTSLGFDNLESNLEEETTEESLNLEEWEYIRKAVVWFLIMIINFEKNNISIANTNSTDTIEPINTKYT